MTSELNLTQQEIDAICEQATDGRQTPALLTVDEAAKLLRVPKGTIYDWRSRGLLDTCSRRVGRRVLFVRDRLLRRILNEGINGND